MSPAIRVGDHVQGGRVAEDYDHGEVLALDQDHALVSWFWSCTRTWAPVETLEPYNIARAKAMAAALLGGAVVRPAAILSDGLHSLADEFDRETEPERTLPSCDSERVRVFFAVGQRVYCGPCRAWHEPESDA